MLQNLRIAHATQRFFEASTKITYVVGNIIDKSLKSIE